MAVSRIHRKIKKTALPIAAIGSVLQLGLAALGAHLGGLTGLSLGWDTALCVEAVIMLPTVFKAVFPDKDTIVSTELFDRNTILMPRISIFDEATALLPRISIVEEETILLPRVSRLEEDTVPRMKVVRSVNNFVLVSDAYCTRCDVPLPPNAHFCGVCGRKVMEKEEARVS